MRFYRSTQEFKEYYAQFKNYGPLSAREELRLLKIIKGIDDDVESLWPSEVEDLWPRNWWDDVLKDFGNGHNGKMTTIQKDAKDSFVLHNMRLVISRVLRFREQDDPHVMELVSHGTEGLFRAVDLFDLGRHVRFSTYAVHWIDSFIRKGLETLGSQRAPVMKQLGRDFKKVEKELLLEYGRRPTNEEVGGQLGWGSTTMTTFLSSSLSNVSVDTCEPEEVRNSPIPEIVTKKELQEALHRSMHILTPAEEDIIRRHYGFGYQEETLQSLADVFRVTKERIRQIENGGLLKLYMQLRRFREA